MMISSRGRYALRVMIDLAEQGPQSYTPMKEVAARQDISLKYLERILPLLVSAGMIQGVQGRGGGYRLTKPPEDYPVLDILRLTEGSLSPVACLESCGEDGCQRSGSCRTRPLWQGLEQRVDEYLAGVTIADLVQPTVSPHP